MKKDFTQIATDAISSADAFINTIAPEREPKPQPERKKPLRQKKVTPDSGELRRICFMADSVTMEKIRALAYLNRKSIANEMRTAIEKYIADYERRNGIIKVR